MTGRSLPEWVAKHPDQKIPPRVRLRVFDRFSGICQITGRKIGAGDRWQCDHILALVNGGEHREGNLQPVLEDPHREKTAEDVAQKAKNDRVRKKHLGLHKPKATLPGSRDSKWKRTIDGRTVRR